MKQKQVNSGKNRQHFNERSIYSTEEKSSKTENGRNIKTMKSNKISKKQETQNYYFNPLEYSHLNDLEMFYMFQLFRKKESERDPRYKTELCKTFINTGYCNYTYKCRFAHGIHDLMEHSNVNKKDYSITKNTNEDSFTATSATISTENSLFDNKSNNSESSNQKNKEEVKQKKEKNNSMEIFRLETESTANIIFNIENTELENSYLKDETEEIQEVPETEEKFFSTYQVIKNLKLEDEDEESRD